MESKGIEKRRATNQKPRLSLRFGRTRRNRECPVVRVRQRFGRKRKPTPADREAIRDASENA